jgi:hypothetical protein
MLEMRWCAIPAAWLAVASGKTQSLLFISSSAVLDVIWLQCQSQVSTDSSTLLIDAPWSVRYNAHRCTVDYSAHRCTVVCEVQC